MKKFIFMSVLICGCGYEKSEVSGDKIRARGTLIERPIDEIEYQGCQYLAVGVNGGVSITHKGNCKNHGGIK